MAEQNTTFARLLRRNVAAVAKIEATVLGERPSSTRMIRGVIRRLGTPTSALLHMLVIAGWIGLNLGAAPAGWRFDPAPFPILELVASIEAILLGILILTSQNRLQHEQDQRAHLGLQVNMLAETELTKVLHMLDQVCKRLGLEATSPEELEELKSDTDPQAIVETIRTSLPSEP